MSKITATFEPSDALPPGAPENQPITGWLVTLRHQGRRMRIHYWQGELLPTPPNAIDVLQCLSVSEPADTFEEYCDDFGLDSDSRKAEAQYKAIKKENMQFRRLMGDEYEGLMEGELDDNLRRHAEGPVESWELQAGAEL